MPKINLKGKEVFCKVIVNPRVKGIKFKMGLGDKDFLLTLTIPSPLSQKELNGIIQEKEDWIVKNYDRLDKLLQQIPQLKFEDGTKIPYLGEELFLVLKREERDSNNISIKHQKDQIIIEAGYDNSSSVLVRVLEAWYREEAKQVFDHRIPLYAKIIGVKYNKIFIKDQKTRWGSCSSQGNLNFNFRLVMGPLFVLDYIIIHELCHIVHPNHSRAFWTLVHKHCPKYKEAKKWLQGKGHTIKLIV